MGSDFFRLLLIPADDSVVRKLAIDIFRQGQADGLRIGGPEQPDVFEKQMLEMCCIRARTPGGIAWKIAEALGYFEGDEDWPWWRLLAASAMSDAIELERLRQASNTGLDPDAELKQAWRAFQDLERAGPAGDSDVDEDAFAEKWQAALSRAAELPARTVVGLSIKVQFLLAEKTEGPSKYHRKIAETALEAAEHLAPGSVPYQPNFEWGETEDAA